MTPRQKAVFFAVLRATITDGKWYRAADHGERVTLASLYYRTLLERKAHRGAEGEADAAHEYRVSDDTLAKLDMHRLPSSPTRKGASHG